MTNLSDKVENLYSKLKKLNGTWRICLDTVQKFMENDEFAWTHEKIYIEKMKKWKTYMEKWRIYMKLRIYMEKWRMRLEPERIYKWNIIEKSEEFMWKHDEFVWKSEKNLYGKPYSKYSFLTSNVF